MTLSYHCQYERSNRIQHIQREIGLGAIVIEQHRRTSYEQQAKGLYGKYVCITDTGVTIVKTEDRQKVITVYVTTIPELVRVYGGVAKVPTELYKKVSYNQTKYIKDGKTIWP